MATLDEIYKKDFNKARSSVPPQGTIYDLKLPTGTLPKQDFYNVKGITEEYYDKLNETNVMLLPRGTELKRRLLNSDGQFRVKKDGSFFTIEIKLPKNAVAVVSNRKIGLPYNHKTDSEGYDYVDYIDVKDDKGNITGKHYIYILPKSVLYKLNFNALAISTKKMKSYSGLSIKTWGYGVLNLCIIPYKPNLTYTSTQILFAKGGLNFDKEIHSVLSELIKLGIVSNPQDYILDDGENIAVTALDPSYNAMEYEATSVTPLASLTDKELDEVLSVQENS